MCLEAGFEMHIVKPVQTRQLNEAIRSVIQKQWIGLPDDFASRVR